MNEREKNQHDTLTLIIHCFASTYLPTCREIFKGFTLAIIELSAF